MEQIIDSRDQKTTKSGSVDRGSVGESQFLASRRSIRIWPIDDGPDLEEKVKIFLATHMGIPDETLSNIKFEAIEKQEQMRRSKVHGEYLVRFFNSQTRDVIQSYAANLANANGRAGLRIDIPDALRGLFRMYESHAAALREKYGGIRRAIRFDDVNRSLYMDVKLNHTDWHRITERDIRDVFKNAKSSLPNTGSTSDLKKSREKDQILLKKDSIPVVESDEDNTENKDSQHSAST